MRAQPVRSPQEFQSVVLPMLVDRWEQKCFCRSPGFLKLLSFDFRDYGNVPAELLDANLVWGEIVAKYFEPLGEWETIAHEPHRAFRCPQCGLEMRSRSQDYSIDLGPVISRPTDGRAIASKGLYLLGVHYFRGFERKKLVDFERAADVERFIESITATS